MTEGLPEGSFPEPEEFTAFDQERAITLLKTVDKITGGMLEERTLALTTHNWESYNKLREQWQTVNTELWHLNHKRDQSLQ